jgi:hypothetical protein
MARPSTTNTGIAARAEALLEPGDGMVGTAVVWAARLGRTPRWLTGRHRYSLVLSERRVLLFARRRRDGPPALDLPLAVLTLERIRHVVWFTQTIVRAHTDDGDRRFLVEFRARDRSTRVAFVDALRAPGPT